MEPVSGVLVQRAAAMRGLPRMVTVSALGHVLLGAALVVWSGMRTADDAEHLRPVMTISLGGAPGPQAGGMTMAGRPFQATAPLPPVARPEPVRPPTARAPEMVLPDPKARPARPAPRRPTGPANDIVSRTAPKPSAEPFGGAAAGAADTNPARGMGFGGLSTGGGSGTGGYLDVKNFCCPDYLVTMLQVIQKNWNARQEVSGETLIQFRILRDGRITEIELERSSGYAALDITAQRALFLTQRVPPLPAAFTDDHLTVHLRFEYHR
jgi:TonB family protein